MIRAINEDEIIMLTPEGEQRGKINFKRLNDRPFFYWFNISFIKNLSNPIMNVKLCFLVRLRLEKKEGVRTSGFFLRDCPNVPIVYIVRDAFH